MTWAQTQGTADPCCEYELLTVILAPAAPTGHTGRRSEYELLTVILAPTSGLGGSLSRMAMCLSSLKK